MRREKDEKLVKFSDIEVFRTFVNKIVSISTYVGRDKNNEAIYNPDLPKPTLEFEGTVKLHGTNSSVAYSKKNGLWAQSKEDVISLQHDNANFAFFVEAHKKDFSVLIDSIYKDYKIDENDTVVLFGEWAGKGIQKRMGINNIEKSFFVFDIKIKPFDKTKASYYIDSSNIRMPENRIFNVHDYWTKKITIDFNRPQDYVEELEKITLEIENECPIAKAFGFEGIGEGVVWTTYWNDSKLRFKVKGVKHQKVNKRTKEEKEIDNELIAKLRDVAEKVTPEWRLEQMLTASCNLLNGGVIDRTKIGSYIRMVLDDVIKEDLDILVDANVTLKEVQKYISNIAVNYFMEEEKKF